MASSSSSSGTVITHVISESGKGIVLMCASSSPLEAIKREMDSKYSFDIRKERSDSPVGYSVCISSKRLDTVKEIIQTYNRTHTDHPFILRDGKPQMKKRKLSDEQDEKKIKKPKQATDAKDKSRERKKVAATIIEQCALLVALRQGEWIFAPGSSSSTVSPQSLGRLIRFPTNATKADAVLTEWLAKYKLHQLLVDPTYMDRPEYKRFFPSFHSLESEKKYLASDLRRAIKQVAYSGDNVLNLMRSDAYGANLYVTKSQTTKLHATIPKTATGIRVKWWRYDDQKDRMSVRYSVVYPLPVVEDKPPHTRIQSIRTRFATIWERLCPGFVPCDQANDLLNHCLERYNLALVHDATGHGYYRSDSRSIHSKLPMTYSKKEHYYHAVFHQMAHHLLLQPMVSQPRKKKKHGEKKKESKEEKKSEDADSLDSDAAIGLAHACRCGSASQPHEEFIAEVFACFMCHDAGLTDIPSPHKLEPLLTCISEGAEAAGIPEEQWCSQLMKTALSFTQTVLHDYYIDANCIMTATDSVLIRDVAALVVSYHHY